MKTPSLALLALLLTSAPGCVYVNVKGDLSRLNEEFLDDDDDDMGFQELTGALEDCVANPKYDLDLEANLWRTKAQWTVRFGGDGDQAEAAFERTKDVIRHRVARQGGQITEEVAEGPGVWSCSFRLDDEPGEARVALAANAEASDRPHRLDVRWRESH